MFAVIKRWIFLRKGHRNGLRIPIVFYASYKCHWQELCADCKSSSPSWLASRQMHYACMTGMNNSQGAAGNALLRSSVEVGGKLGRNPSLVNQNTAFPRRRLSSQPARLYVYVQDLVVAIKRLPLTIWLPAKSRCESNAANIVLIQEWNVGRWMRALCVALISLPADTRDVIGNEERARGNALL